MIKLGEGYFYWSASERRTDRYGYVYLESNNPHLMPVSERYTQHTANFVNLNTEGIIGKYGKLIVKILERHESGHIGDLFHGFFPSIPEEDEFELGEGTVFIEDDIKGIGLKPKDDRDVFWLDPKQLYKAHEQKLELYFKEEA